MISEPVNHISFDDVRKTWLAFGRKNASAAFCPRPQFLQVRAKWTQRELAATPSPSEATAHQYPAASRMSRNLVASLFDKILIAKELRLLLRN
jgi:hypothetical protein